MLYRRDREFKLSVATPACDHESIACEVKWKLQLKQEAVFTYSVEHEQFITLQGGGRGVNH